jgi:hypothetical protein
MLINLIELFHHTMQYVTSYLYGLYVESIAAEGLYQFWRLNVNCYSSINVHSLCGLEMLF